MVFEHRALTDTVEVLSPYPEDPRWPAVEEKRVDCCDRRLPNPLNVPNLGEPADLGPVGVHDHGGDIDNIAEPHEAARAPTNGKRG